MDDRRTFLGRLAGLSVVTLGAGGLAAVTSSCTPSSQPPQGTAVTSPTPPQRFSYGDDPSQWADLYLPDGAPRGVVVVIHGGFWRAAYDASLGVPLARSLASQGWAAWNLEYRRVGDGGGVPETLDDVAAGIDLLDTVDGLPLRTVVTLGHSAGGHLAVWAAARSRFPRWSPVRVAVTAAISQAGVLDLDAGYEQGLGGTAVLDFVGEAPGPAYDEVSPQRQLPLEIPVFCVHGRDDDVVPLEQSTGYVQAAREAGARAEVVEVDGDHFVVIDTRSPAWQEIEAILDRL